MAIIRNQFSHLPFRSWPLVHTLSHQYQCSERARAHVYIQCTHALTRVQQTRTHTHWGGPAKPKKKGVSVLPKNICVLYLSLSKYGCVGGERERERDRERENCKMLDEELSDALSTHFLGGWLLQVQCDP